MNKPLIFLSFAIAIVTSAMGNTSNTQTPNDAKRAELSAKKSETSDAITEKFNAISDNALTMRTHERTTSNKLLGAGGMGAAGIGGAMVASATSENNADTDAEREMRAYLATFHCNYGTGQNIPGGETDIELPGGNELIGLYSEYVNLANDLKVRKTALGMRPGIESEPILDAATSGLYDDISVGKTSGAYTSLARALMDPTGADATAWAAQRAETAEKQKSGSTILVAGLAGSLAGNLAMNADAPRDRSAKLTNEYNQLWALLQKLEDDINNITPQPEPCPTGTTGTHPNCDCGKSAIYNDNTHECEQCIGGQIAKEGRCECPIDDKPLWDYRTSECVEQTDTCPLKGFLVDKEKCECIQYAKQNENNECVCDTENGFVKTDKNECEKETTPPQSDAKQDTITLPADSLFANGKSDITEDAKTALNKFLNEVKKSNEPISCLEIGGYTDGTGSDEYNQELSVKRATAIKNYLIDNSGEKFTAQNIKTTGYGEDYCNCGNGIPPGKETEEDYRQCFGKKPKYTSDNLKFAPCRKVEIKFSNECEQPQ